MPVTSYLYDAKGRDQKVSLSAKTLKQIGRERLLWIDVDSRDAAELEQVAQALGLSDDCLANLIEPRGARLQNFGTYIQVAVETAPAIVDMEAFARQPSGSPTKPHMRLDFVINKGWLLTVHDGEIEFIRAFRAQERAETTIGSLTTHDFAASLLDLHLEAYFQEVARIEGLIDKLDEQALTRPSSKSLLGRMVSLRRRVSRLRTLLSAQRPVFYGLSRPDLQNIAQAGASSHFQILASRFERAIDEVEHTRDLVVGSFELFASRTAQQTNELVKVLTFLTAVIGFCAAIAGVFGMNFETGFFASGDFGFYFTIAMLFAIIVVSAMIARWQRWL
jgi:Mg2+ and Co2+ transporter CorA